jgi:hypothetical protein
MGLQIDEAEDFYTVKIYPKDIINHLLLVWAIKYIEHSPTAYNDGTDPARPCDVVVVDVVDLDQADEDGQLGLIGRQSWWRQGRLIQKLRGRVGRPNPLLGRMAKGVGPNGAFELVDLSADERAVARANNWWQLHQDFLPSAVGNEVPAQPQRIAQQTLPPPPPSPLEQQARNSLGPLDDSQRQTLDRLRQMGAQRQSDGPPPF